MTVGTQWYGVEDKVRTVQSVRAKHDLNSID